MPRFGINSVTRLYISTILIFIAMVGVFLLATKFVDQQDIRTALNELPGWMLPALLSLSLVNYSCRLIRWKLLLGGQRIDISTKTAFLSYFAGLSMTATPGKFGEIIRLWLLEKLERVPYPASLSALVGDRVADILAVLILGSLGFEAVSKHSLALLAVAIVVAFLVALWHRLDLLAPPLKLIYQATGRFRRKIARARYLLRTCRPRFTYTQAGEILCLSLVGWLAEGIGFYFLINALGDHISVAIAVSIFCLSILLGAISMLPGGIGSTELVMIALLQAAGCHMEVSVVATGIMRIATLWFAVFVGLLVIPVALRAASKTSPLE